jgi:hypothetical protein
MKKFVFRFSLPFCFFIQLQTTCSGQDKASIIVLGVTHSMQLVNPRQQPALLRAFFDRVNPKAICIESTPEQYAQNDFYEFTYEQQHCLIPYARKKSIPVYPIDWWPGAADLGIALGTNDVEYPPFIRQGNGFRGFVYFEDSSVFKHDLYYAEATAARNELKEWYTVYPEKLQFDFARRLFLYRTFMQSMHIKKAAENYAKDTILVVVGSYHKDDIEKTLSGFGFTIINPADFGTFNHSEAGPSTNMEDIYAIASFNLLGLQSTTIFLDTSFLNTIMGLLWNDKMAENSLLDTRWKLLTKKISTAQAIDRYKNALNNLSREIKFTWTGVKNEGRLDSYFDPFGNMTVWQRINLELAREYYKLKNEKSYAEVKQLLLNEFAGVKKYMLTEYIKLYLEK